ncbi:MAG: hypothetical protein KC944_08580 [Candidatus Omnitrophica bacterium]|nr:hypothetical protein [Candidatus Omnitrophota bacterium]MCA9435477.1 hypothetical protein [Candidatus Omnitrophota bacterium]
MNQSTGSTHGNVRGEHYAKKIFDLPKFITAVLYPALDKYLDKAFPEFGFKRGPQGHWVATDAPVHYRDYGHRNNKLIGTGWGFRSLGTGRPAVLWLSYVNRRSFPTPDEFFSATKRLGERIRITWDWSVSRDEIQQALLQEKRDHILEALFAYAQGALHEEAGRYTRGYLARQVGFPLHKLQEIDIGFYPSVHEVQDALMEAQFTMEEDQNLSEVLGVFHPKWEGRIIGPVWDVSGARVVNLWGRHPGETPVGEAEYVSLNRPDPSQPFGGKEFPIGLHRAAQLKKKNLLLVESPVHALMVQSMGVEDPFPIAAGGKLTSDQARTLQKFLQRSGTLTLNFDYNPNLTDIHVTSNEAIETLTGNTYPLYVVDPVEMAGKGNYPRRVDPASLIRTKGVQHYRVLLSKRTDVQHYRGHAKVVEYASDDPQQQDTGKDVIDTVEGLVDSLEGRHRAPELDELFNSIAMDTPIDLPEEEDEGEIEFEIPQKKAPSTSAIQPPPDSDPMNRILNHAKSIMEYEGLERATEFLQSQLKKEAAARVVEESQTPSGPMESDTARFSPHSPDPKAGQLAESLRGGLAKIAREVEEGKMEISAALEIVLRCQRGVQSLLEAIQRRSAEPPSP